MNPRLLERIPLVRELRTVAETLFAAAYVDTLTHVFTRNAYVAFVDTPDETIYAAAYFDLNGFKAINEAHGHEGGDAALEHFGRSLLDLSESQSGLIPFRMGGDEFLALLPATAVEALRSRLDDLVIRSFEWDGTTVEYGASIGCALGDADLELDDIRERAELAAHVAKTTQSRVAVWWNDALTREATAERRHRCSQCRAATVVQVPQVSLRTSCLTRCPNCDEAVT